MLIWTALVVVSIVWGGAVASSRADDDLIDNRAFREMQSQVGLSDTELLQLRPLLQAYLVRCLQGERSVRTQRDRAQRDCFAARADLLERATAFLGQEPLGRLAGKVSTPGFVYTLAHTR